MLKVFATCGALTTCFAVYATSFSASAEEIPQAVKDACRGDYLKNCAMHMPGSDGGRDCMADAFDQLSKPCVSAILNSHLADRKVQPERQEKQLVEKKVQPEKQEADVAETATSDQDNAADLHASNKREARTQHPPKRYAKATRRNAKPARHMSVAHRDRAVGSSKVARYIDRGTRIANSYVSKYTRIAFAKVFH
jgi:hypothetical protein